MCYIVIGLIAALLALFLVPAAMVVDSKDKQTTKDALTREMHDVTSPSGCLCAVIAILTGALILSGLIWLLSLSDSEPTVCLPWAPR